MSKKDFIAIANTIREHNRHCDATGQEHLSFNDMQIEALAQTLKSMYPRFDYQRWIVYVENGK